MPATTRAEIRALLYGHYAFADCVLEGIRWRDQGATVDLVFNYIWADAEGHGFDGRRHVVLEGKQREDLERPAPKVLRLHLLQELHVHNWWNAAIEAEGPGVLDWGASAVAVVEVHDDNLFLAKYRDRAVEYHHVVALWEGDRRIDAVCAGVEIVSNGA